MGEEFRATPTSVLAVLVVYGRPLGRAEAWPTLRALLAASGKAQAGRLGLAHVLIYDNSPDPWGRPAAPVAGCTYVHDPGNGGTAAAYREAVRLATTLGIGWLLLLDHDTSLPPALLRAAEAELAKAAPVVPAAILPWVRHGEAVVSPARLTRFGSVRPLAPGAPLATGAPLTAIASGSLLRLGAVDDALRRMPAALWLDYVDHWLFAQLAARGEPVAVIDCSLQHDLSVTRLDRLDPARLESVLAAESAFVAALPWPARAAHPWRLLERALRVLPARPAHAAAMLRQVVRKPPAGDAASTDPDAPVSVVMAVYNGERFLAPQVESVLAQLGSRDELLVIDDASTDDSAGWLGRVDDPRIRVLRHTRNAGVRRSFEHGLREARHGIVFLCDQDDVWLPGKRDAMVAEFARDPRTLVVVSDAEVIDAGGAPIAPSFMALRHGFRRSLLHTLVRSRYLGCAMAVRRELIDAALPIPASAPMHDMWLGALGSVLGRVRYVRRPLIQYRRHDGNVSPSRPQGCWRMLRWRAALLAAVGVRLVRLALGRREAVPGP